MIVAGLGFRKGVSAESLKAALALVGRPEALATASGKHSEPGLRELSAEYGLQIIAVPRDAGGKLVTFCTPRSMSPDEAASCPAIMRRVVVFPQPEGPSRQQ